jgi:hypothetical protein
MDIKSDTERRQDVVLGSEEGKERIQRIQLDSVNKTIFGWSSVERFVCLAAIEVPMEEELGILQEKGDEIGFDSTSEVEIGEVMVEGGNDRSNKGGEIVSVRQETVEAYKFKSVSEFWSNGTVYHFDGYLTATAIILLFDKYGHIRKEAIRRLRKEEVRFHELIDAVQRKGTVGTRNPMFMEIYESNLRSANFLALDDEAFGAEIRSRNYLNPITSENMMHDHVLEYDQHMLHLAKNVPVLHNTNKTVSDRIANYLKCQIVMKRGSNHA